MNPFDRKSLLIALTVRVVILVVFAIWSLCGEAHAEPKKEDGCRVIYDPITQTCRVYCPPVRSVG